MRGKTPLMVDFAEPRGDLGWRDEPGTELTIPQARSSLRSDEFLVTGAVRVPGSVVSTFDLGSRAQGPARVRYVTRSCDRVDQVYGVTVRDLLSGIGLLVRDDHKMGHLTIVVLARGEDGYQVALSWGEIDEEFGACAALLATRYNDVELRRPTLVLPHDGRGSRYVRMLSELRVLDLAT